MKFLKSNAFTLLAFALVFAMTMIGDANAESVMGTAQTKALNVFKAVKTIVFVIGGFGLIALAFQAIFGKVKWPWFAGLAFGLAVLAAAGAIVDYATGASKSSESGFNADDFDDTFSSSTTN